MKTERADPRLRGRAQDAVGTQGPPLILATSRAPLRAPPPGEAQRKMKPQSSSEGGQQSIKPSTGLRVTTRWHAHKASPATNQAPLRTPTRSQAKRTALRSSVHLVQPGHSVPSRTQTLVHTRWAVTRDLLTTSSLHLLGCKMGKAPPPPQDIWED